MVTPPLPQLPPRFTQTRSSLKKSPELSSGQIFVSVNGKQHVAESVNGYKVYDDLQKVLNFVREGLGDQYRRLMRTDFASPAAIARVSSVKRKRKIWEETKGQVDKKMWPSRESLNERNVQFDTAKLLQRTNSKMLRHLGYKQYLST